MKKKTKKKSKSKSKPKKTTTRRRPPAITLARRGVWDVWCLPDDEGTPVRFDARSTQTGEQLTFVPVDSIVLDEVDRLHSELASACATARTQADRLTLLQAELQHERTERAANRGRPDPQELAELARQLDVARKAYDDLVAAGFGKPK